MKVTMYQKFLKAKAGDKILPILKMKEWKVGDEQEFYELVKMAMTERIGYSSEIKKFVKKYLPTAKDERFKEFYEILIELFDELSVRYIHPGSEMLISKWKFLWCSSKVDRIKAKPKKQKIEYKVKLKDPKSISDIRVSYLSLTPYIMKSIRKITKKNFTEIENDAETRSRLRDVTAFSDITQTKDGFNITINNYISYSAVIVYVYNINESGEEEQLFDINSAFGEYAKDLVRMTKAIHEHRGYDK